MSEVFLYPNCRSHKRPFVGVSQGSLLRMGTSLEPFGTELGKAYLELSDLPPVLLLHVLYLLQEGSKFHQ